MRPRSTLFAVLASSLVASACTSTTIIEPSSTSAEGGTGNAVDGATGPVANAGGSAQDATPGSAAPEGGAGTGGGTDAEVAFKDCPPCWQQWYCVMPPDYEDGLYLAGTEQADGSCVLTPLDDGGESLTIPLECVTNSASGDASSNPPVLWSVGTSGTVTNVMFDIPSRGGVTCEQT
jgi:hypothetical protein